MNIQNEKLYLIEWLARIEDTSIIREFVALKKRKESDWRDKLTKEEKEDIKAGLNDLEKGRKRDFKKVLAKYR